MKRLPILSLYTAAVSVLAGCSHNNPSGNNPPVMMAPPATPVTISQPMGQSPNGQGAADNGQAGAYNWTDVPVGQQVQITRAVFDQGGYQLYSPQGTIVVPFANQNMYVMKFGQSQTGGMYFINNGQFPTLYIPPGASIGNAAQPGANWYPFPQNYNYTNPVYVGLAPSWSAFSGMGWYPGMSYYGGYYGYSPYSIIGPMVGLHFLIGGSPYYGWNSYHSYYSSHPYGYASMRVVNRTVYNQAARTSFNSGGFGRRTFGSAGSTFGNRSIGGSRSTGSFGRSPSGFGSSTPRPAFGSGSSGGSFGRGPSGFGGSFGSTRRSFPAASPAPSSGSFGSRPAFGGGGSFGGGSAALGPRSAAAPLGAAVSAAADRPSGVVRLGAAADRLGAADGIGRNPPITSDCPPKTGRRRVLESTAELRGHSRTTRAQQNYEGAAGREPLLIVQQLRPFPLREGKALALGRFLKETHHERYDFSDGW